MSEIELTTNAEAIIDAAREMREVRPEHVSPLETEVVLVRGSDGQVKRVELDDLLPAPRRATGTHQPADVASLVKLLDDLDDQATVWVHPTSGRIEALFDDHTADSPGHGDHRAVLQLQKTPAWERWMKYDRQFLTQADFADHIEDSIPDIASPPGADLLEIASTLTGKTEVNWKAGVRLDSGSVQLVYNEEETATAGRDASMEIPKAFTLMLAPFLGEDPVPLTARLRYRVKTGHLTLGYVLDRPEDVIQDCVTAVRERLAEEFTRVYLGAPR